MNPKVYKCIAMIPIHIMIFPLWHIRRGIGKNNCLSPTEFRDLANGQSTLKLPSRFPKPYFRRTAGPGSHAHVVVFVWYYHGSHCTRFDTEEIYLRSAYSEKYYRVTAGKYPRDASHSHVYINRTRTEWTIIYSRSAVRYIIYCCCIILLCVRRTRSSSLVRSDVRGTQYNI